MRIGVVGDSHGDRVALEKVAVRFNEDKVDLIIHTGDYFSDSHILEAKTGCKVIAVFGNCDGPTTVHNEAIVTYEGYTFLIIHGHQCNVKYDLNGLFYRALESNARIVLFGHTHTPLMTECDGVWFMNPGSVHHPRGTVHKTYGLITLYEGGEKNPLFELKIL